MTGLPSPLPSTCPPDAEGGVVHVFDLGRARCKCGAESAPTPKPGPDFY